MAEMQTTENLPRYAHLKAPARIVPSPCSRCGGRGGSVCWPGWTCFRCGGQGVDPTYRAWGFPSEWKIEQIAAWQEKKEARRRSAAAKREAKRQAEAQTQIEANVATYPVLEGLLPRLSEFTGFIYDILSKASRYPLSEAQVAAVVKAIEDQKAYETAQVERTAAKTAAGYLGEVGEKISTEATVTFAKGFDGRFGYQLLVIFEDDEGRTLKTWTTARWSEDIEVGERLSLRATVKAHETRNGLPETLLTRVATDESRMMASKKGAAR